MAMRAGVFAGAADIHEAVIDAIEWGDTRHVVQVAGGSGTLLAAILRRLPDATGVLFDRPEVVAEAGPTLYAAGVADRVDCAAGQLVRDIPPGGDLYVAAKVFGGWTDERILTLLRHCREVVASSARLVIAEPTAPPARSCDSWRELLTSAGFRPSCVTGTAYDWCVIESCPD